MGWELVRLGDVCTVDKAKHNGELLPYVGMEHIQSGTGRLALALSATQVKSTSFAFKKDHVLYGRLRPYLNKVLLPEFEGHCSTEIFPLQCSSGLNRRLLFYWLTSEATVRLIDSTSTGARMPRANVNSVMNFQIPLPPLPEQNRIIAILDEAFAGIDKAISNTKRNLTNARELFESYLNNVFTQKGEGWEEKKLGEVCDLHQGLAINRKTKHLLVPKSSLPLLRIKDLKNNTEEQYVKEEGYPVNALVNEEDIIYTRTGNSLGLVFRGRRGVLHNNSFKIDPNYLVNRGFLYWWLQEQSFKEKIFKLAYRAAQPDITHTLFKAQLISIPPLQYQEEAIVGIERFAKDTEQLKSVYQQKLTSLSELKQAILQKAFTGELTKDFIH